MFILLMSMLTTYNKYQMTLSGRLTVIMMWRNLKPVEKLMLLIFLLASLQISFVHLVLNCHSSLHAK